MKFYKYHGTGNDFILLNNLDGSIELTTDQVAFLCNRRFGIGADGLMLLETAEGYDFRMVYFNSDGGESTMCGNGGRCITAFAKAVGIIENSARFVAIYGEHTATIADDGLISLHMQDVSDILFEAQFTELNTGSPHYVLWADDVKQTDVYTRGRQIRNQSEYQPNGINVNFMEWHGSKLWVRTYERGVEDETLSCGTGVTAAAIAATGMETGKFVTNIETPGGFLTVTFTKDQPGGATDVVLIGPAEFVFEGEI